MPSHYDIFQSCKSGDAKGQRILYDLFKGKLMGLCRRYTRSREEAQDVLQESFIKIFKNFDQLNNPEKLESWMKSIAVREAINQYHKGKVRELTSIDIDSVSNEIPIFQTSIEHLTDEYLISLVNALPDGCRIIFNLFAIEGYSHSEIATMLQISEGTSRSQFYYGKQLLKEKLNCQNILHYYEKFS